MSIYKISMVHTWKTRALWSFRVETAMHARYTVKALVKYGQSNNNNKAVKKKKIG